MKTKRGERVVVIDSSFIGNFKLGDNINFNLSAAAALYAVRHSTTNGTHARALCKPICVTLISIIEALLHDLHRRVQVFTREGVKSIASGILAYIRAKQLDKMDHLIGSARKHNLLHAEANFYTELDELRQVRNRVHIQNSPPRLEPDEYQVFTPTMVVRAEIALERVMRALAEHYARPTHAGHVEDFQLPWDTHLGLPATQPPG